MTDNEQATKPTVQLSGEDGNIFSIMGRCSRALKRAGMEKEAQEMTTAMCGAGSYDEALQIAMGYVDTR